MNLQLMPPVRGTCPRCAVDHPPTEPHNNDSLYWQYWFYGVFGRWPTWADAIAHCPSDVRTMWETELRRLGAWSCPVAGVDVIAVGDDFQKRVRAAVAITVQNDCDKQVEAMPQYIAAFDPGEQPNVAGTDFSLLYVETMPATDAGEQPWRFIDFNPRRALRGVGAARMEFNGCVLWCDRDDIGKNLEEWGNDNPELLRARDAYNQWRPKQ